MNDMSPRDFFARSQGLKGLAFEEGADPFSRGPSFPILRHNVTHGISEGPPLKDGIIWVER